MASQFNLSQSPNFNMCVKHRRSGVANDLMQQVNNFDDDYGSVSVSVTLIRT